MSQSRIWIGAFWNKQMTINDKNKTYVLFVFENFDFTLVYINAVTVMSAFYSDFLYLNVLLKIVHD